MPLMLSVVATDAPTSPVFAGGRSGLMFGVVLVIVVIVLCLGMTWLIRWTEQRKRAGRPKPVTWWRWSLNVAISIAFLAVLVVGAYFFWQLIKDS